MLQTAVKQICATKTDKEKEAVTYMVSLDVQ